MLHEFNKSCKVEERWAPVLDTWFKKYCHQIREAKVAEQWRGIDRFCVLPNGQDGTSFDYKCDEQTQGTGNVFIETVSNEQLGRPGWVHTSEADWIVYFVVPNEILFFLMDDLRFMLSDWDKHYRKAKAPNKRGSERYNSVGICVPLEEARRAARHCVKMENIP